MSFLSAIVSFWTGPILRKRPDHPADPRHKRARLWPVLLGVTAALLFGLLAYRLEISEAIGCGFTADGEPFWTRRFSKRLEWVPGPDGIELMSRGADGPWRIGVRAVS